MTEQVSFWRHKIIIRAQLGEWSDHCVALFLRTLLVQSLNCQFSCTCTILLDNNVVTQVSFKKTNEFEV